MILNRIPIFNQTAIVLGWLLVLGCQKKADEAEVASAAKTEPRSAEKKKIKPEDNFIAVTADKITGKTWLKDFDSEIKKIPPSSTYLLPDGKIRNSADAAKFCQLFKGDKLYLTDERPSNYKDSHVYLKISRIERGALGLKYLEEVRTKSADLKPALEVSSKPTTDLQNPVTSIEAQNSSAPMPTETVATEITSAECTNTKGWLYVPHLQETDIAKLSEGECCSFPLKILPPEFCEGHPVRGFGAGRTSDDGSYREHAACDLYGDVGHGIYAVDDGKVTDFYDFYLGTYAVIVQHPGFLVRYGEISGIASGVEVGSMVKKGQKIASIGQLAGLDYSMLHFEMYSGNASGALSNDSSPFRRRSDLLNPIPQIKKWMKNLPR